MNEPMAHTESEENRIPEFHNYEEEAEFWDTHDFSEFWNEAKSVEAQVAESLSEQNLSF